MVAVLPASVSIPFPANVTPALPVFTALPVLAPSAAVVLLVFGVVLGVEDDVGVGVGEGEPAGVVESLGVGLGEALDDEPAGEL